VKWLLLCHQPSSNLRLLQEVSCTVSVQHYLFFYQRAIVIYIHYNSRMSLSFVSKAIQTTTEDGTFEEKAIENPEGETAGTSMTGSGQNLYDQLRKNKEDADEEREEFQRSIMRGTLALDDDDAAHLEQLNKKRWEERARTQQQTATELAAFRAARADRQHNNNPQEQQQQDTSTKSYDLQAFATEGPTAETSSEKKFVPTFIMKKRKRAVEDGKTTSTKIEPAIKNNMPEQDDSKDSKHSVSKEPEKKNEQGQGISNLLAGYSSSSEDEEDDGE